MRPLSSYSAELQGLFDRIGPVWGSDTRKHRDMVLDALEPYLAAAASDDISCAPDISYGRDARHVLDIYRCRTASSGKLPVVIYMHGGGYVRGDKDATKYVYGNVPTWFARQGYVAINLEYRLAPAIAYPGAAEDLADAIAWVGRTIADHGGDPERVFLVGHSAGGTHVAHYVLDPALAHFGRNISAAAIISGRLRADVSALNPNAAGVRAYFGVDESAYERLSPVSMVSAQAIPLFVAIAEYENPLLDCYGAEFFHQLRACGHRANQFVMMSRHNHMSIMAHFNTEEELLGRQICDFFQRHGA